MTGPLFAAIREALADTDASTLIAEQLSDLTPADLERALDALMAVAAVGQRMANRRVAV